MILSQPGDVRNVFAECFNRTTALIPRVSATCSTCILAGGDLPLWMNATEHPLANYVHDGVIDTAKSLLRPDEVVSHGVHWAFIRHGDRLESSVAGECGVLFLHVVDMYHSREEFHGGWQGNITDWQWVLDRI